MIGMIFEGKHSGNMWTPEEDFRYFRLAGGFKYVMCALI
jgi:hypothetical protein